MRTSAEPPHTISSSLARSWPARRRSTTLLTRESSTSAACFIMVNSSRPPPMVPAMVPSRRTSISAPAARSMEPRSPISFTSAMSSPPSSSLRTSSRMSLTSSPPILHRILQAFFQVASTPCVRWDDVSLRTSLGAIRRPSAQHSPRQVGQAPWRVDWWCELSKEATADSRFWSSWRRADMEHLLSRGRRRTSSVREA